MKIGKYEIEDELGRGSMGVVYRARDTLLDRHVAIKLISTEALDDWTKKLFEREAKAVARMSHPNIVVVYDFDYFENQPYIAMELLKGASLDDLFYEKKLELKDTLDIIHQTLNGLQHAHDQGVIHRDIKPTNIFVSDSGVVKIMDFGVARLAATSSTVTEGFVLGTPEYMSPEQVKAESLDGRTDLFSVGTMLYWLFTNETPFSADTAHSTMFKIVNEEPSPLQVKGISHHVLADLQSILNRALAKDPAERFASASDMAKEVKSLILLVEQEADFQEEDPDFENAETVQVPIPKFTTVKKTAQMKSLPPFPSETPAKETKQEPPEIERTMQLRGQIPDLSVAPEVTMAPPPLQRTRVEVPTPGPVRRFSKKNIIIALILLLAALWGIYRVIVAQKIPTRPHPVVTPGIVQVCLLPEVRQEALNLRAGTPQLSPVIRLPL